MKRDLSLNFIRLHNTYVCTYAPRLKPVISWKTELIDWTARTVAPERVRRQMVELQSSLEPLEQLSHRWLNKLNLADQTCIKLEGNGSPELYRLHKFFPTGKKRTDEEWTAFLLEVGSFDLSLQPELAAKLKNLSDKSR